MQFTFEQLRVFVAVAEEQHFGRAADRLRMTQPPVSRQVRALEAHLDVKLFERTNRGVTVTAAGQELLPRARRILQLAEETSASVRQIAAGVTGRVRVGFSAVVGNAVIPALFRAAADSIPDVQIACHEMQEREMATALASGRLDLALSREFTQTDELGRRALAPDELVLAVPEGFPAAGEEVTSLMQLEGRDLLMYSSEATYLQGLVLSVLVAHQLYPRLVESGPAGSILGLVNAGLGAAIVPRSTWNWAGRNTHFVNVPELREFPTEAVATWTAHDANPALPRVLEVLENIGAFATQDDTQ